MTVFDKLKEFGITFIGGSPAGVQLGFGPRRDMVFECPLQLRPGKYDVGIIGAFTYLGGDDSIFRHIKSIGRYCSIAGGIKTGLAEHPIDFLSTHPLFYGQWREWSELGDFYSLNHEFVMKAKNCSVERLAERNQQIVIGNDVWIGENVTILRGVSIGDGAVVASGALVTRDVEPYSIVGGIPAKLIKYRFESEVRQRLMNIQWWDYSQDIFLGVDFSNIERALDVLEKNVSDVPRFVCTKVKVDTMHNVHELA